MNTQSAMRTPAEMLAMHLDIPKSDLNPHARNHTDWFTEILEHWVRVVTEEFVINPEVRALPPIDRLTRIAGIMMSSDLARYETTIVQWALQDETAAHAIHTVNCARLDFVRTAFADAGFGGDDLEMRSRIFTCYFAYAGPMFHDVSRKQLRELIGKQLEILVSQ